LQRLILAGLTGPIATRAAMPHPLSAASTGCSHSVRNSFSSFSCVISVALKGAYETTVIVQVERPLEFLLVHTQQCPDSVAPHGRPQ